MSGVEITGGGGGSFFAGFVGGTSDSSSAKVVSISSDDDDIAGDSTVSLLEESVHGGLPTRLRKTTTSASMAMSPISINARAVPRFRVTVIICMKSPNILKPTVRQGLDATEIKLKLSGK